MPAETKTSLDLLVEEAARQLNICNACRYCEGYCAVFPALERRNLLAESDVTQLANLCHDCRACYDACMYTPPHEFAVNIPKVLSEARLESYGRYVWPTRVPRLFRGWPGVFAGAVVSAVVLVVIALSTVGPAALVATPEGGAWSPYQVIPYPALVVVMFAPAVYAVIVMGVAARRFWVDVGGNTVPFRFGSVWRAALDSLSLRNLRGGGEDCYYPDDERPSPTRRHLHGLVAYGFGLCTLSTISAAVLQHLLGSEPPYPVVSVPVISGLLGGTGIVMGCTGLLRMKAASSKVTSFAEMTIKDYGLLVALHFLALSGLATFLLRDTTVFGVVFLVHISAVALTFAVAPYSKFVHLVYRFLALVRDNLE